MPKLPHAEWRYRQELAELFQNSGWAVSHHPGGVHGVDLLISQGQLKYAVEVKRAAESRRDRVVPLLAEAILQAQAHARSISHGRALAVVVSPRFSRLVVEQALQFASLHAENVAVGLLDDHGFRVFRGAGLEVLNSPFPDYNQRPLFSDSQSYSIFSDLGQWMLKVILARNLDPKLLRAPREPIHNASELASAASVSPVSASRFLRQLEADNFIDRHSSELRVARVNDLLEEWEAVSRRCYKEIPARWILPHQGDSRLKAGLSSYAVNHQGSDRKGKALQDARSPRVCLGLFAAAEALGVGLVHGAAPVIYIESLDAEVLERLGISSQKAQRADVYLRVPVFKESIFRAAVDHDGIPVSDVLQIWLDVWSHPSRGKEQADYLRNILEPLLGA